MKVTTPDWSPEEFKAYILLYAAGNDTHITADELQYIHSKVDDGILQKMQAEIQQDNDYQSIQKITRCLECFDYKKDDLDQLFAEIEQLYLADGKFDISERNIFHGLKKLL